MIGGTLNQPFIFAATVYAGIILGILYSLFRVVRKLFGAGKLMSVILDIVFTMLMSLLIGYLLYYVSNLIPRFYHVVGVLIGFLTYVLAAEPFFIILLKKVRKIVVDIRTKKYSNRL